MKRVPLHRRLIGTFVCLTVLVFAPAYQAEAWAELGRLWPRRAR